MDKWDFNFAQIKIYIFKSMALLNRPTYFSDEIEELEISRNIHTFGFHYMTLQYNIRFSCSSFIEARID